MAALGARDLHLNDENSSSQRHSDEIAPSQLHGGQDVASQLRDPAPEMLDHLASYSDILHKTIQGHFPGIADEDIELIIEDGAYAAFKTFDPRRSNIRTWLTKNVYWKALEFCRRHKSLVISGIDPSTLPAVGITDGRPADTRQLSRQIKELLQDLSPRQRLAVLLWVCEKRPYECIAEELGVTQSTARSYVSKGLGHLRELAKTRNYGPTAIRKG